MHPLLVNLQVKFIKQNKMTLVEVEKFLELIKNSGLTIIGDIVLEKHNEAGSIGVQLNTQPPKAAAPKSAQVKTDHSEKPPQPCETMTFKRKGSVLEGHLALLFNKLAKEGWIEGNEASFKALFSGKRDAECMLTWAGQYGKSTLVELFRQLINAGLIALNEGFTLSAILEGHFRDRSGQCLTGLDKGNTPNEKALPMIRECVKLLQADPKQLIYGAYDEDEDFQLAYDSYDHQDMHLHRR